MRSAFLRITESQVERIVNLVINITNGNEEAIRLMEKIPRQGYGTFRLEKQ